VRVALRLESVPFVHWLVEEEMTKDDLLALNSDLITLLTNLRDQIDDALEELGIATSDDADTGTDDDGTD
jgi:hypothetical protein